MPQLISDHFCLLPNQSLSTHEALHLKNHHSADEGVMCLVSSEGCTALHEDGLRKDLH